jgi:tRNA dimethylallyltransferase
MAQAPRKRAVLIAGPTASGKSALALCRARELGGVVVNTDAMQVYDVLQVVTARPSTADMQGVPHLLYGTVSPSQRYSTGEWLRDVGGIIEGQGDRPLVFAGGTGLYFDALANGFAEVPEVPDDVIREVEAELAGLDREARGRLIAERDPATAALLRAPDPQRVARALAVLKATGRSLASFQGGARAGLLEHYDIERVVLDTDRDVLRQRIAERFSRMLDAGAIDEVERLLALDLDPGLPVMKAIGVREIAQLIAGSLTREEVVERAAIATRQYAKRQRTWFRNRMADWPRLAT